jgi:outer membrane protein assembly factor BamA
VPDLFDPVPYGFQERTRFVRFDVSAGLDLTHREALQVRGASLRVGASLFRGVNGTDTDFHRFGADLRGFVPLNRRQILAVRAFAELNRLDDGPDIPFFHLASVGSTTGLRGFSSDRFTDTDSFGVMSEWRWEIWRDLHERSRSEFFLFFDTAGVGPGLSNITTSGVRFSWGLGMRLLTLQRYIGHWYLGFSEEGTRFRIDNSVIF